MPAKFLIEAAKEVVEWPPSDAFRPTMLDVTDAAALDAYMRQCWEAQGEEVLRGIVGLFYMRELFSNSEAEKVECLSQLRAAGVPGWHLKLLLAFGDELLGPRSTSVLEAEEDVLLGMESLWLSFCSSRVIHGTTGEVFWRVPAGEHLSRFCAVEVVRGGELYPILPPDYQMFVKQYRPSPAPASAVVVAAASEGVVVTTARKLDESGKQVSGFPGLSSVTPELSPVIKVRTLFELTHRILHSRYFLCLPLENLGHNLKRHSGEGWAKALPVYRQVAGIEVEIQRLPPDEQNEEHSCPLLIPELFKLLDCAKRSRKGSLLRALISSRPPHSMLPHFHAALDCSRHARLWLAGLNIKVYLDCDITYAMLGLPEIADAEKQALGSIFMQERVPSCLEMTQRCNAYEQLCCGWDAEVLVLTPADYDMLQAPDNAMWRAVRERLSYCINYAPDHKVDPAEVLRAMTRIYGPYLGYDKKWQQLHPQLDSSNLPLDFATKCSLPGVAFQR